MINQGEFNSVLREKISNTILYLTQGRETAFVKILKLLYLTDELAVKEEGAPITWLSYYAWKRGPVPVDVYNEVEAMVLNKEPISNETSLNLHKYFSTKQDDGTKIICPKSEVDIGKLSENEIGLLNRILSLYGHMSAQELVDITHDKDSLWLKVVEQNKLDEYFKLNGDRSNYPVDFISLIDTEYKKSIYTESLDSLRFNKYF
ncbi:hypothetical protein BH11BAC7_BH11BAC7_36670 [soil metagenome]